MTLNLLACRPTAVPVSDSRNDGEAKAMTGSPAVERLAPARHLAILLAATVIMLSTAPAANAFLGVFMLAERTITKESARALATPGHADWCARQQPGYRKQWNNWRLPNGRVKYCASPYFTPLWMKRPN